MLRLKQSDLPHRGSSYNFVGADNGGVNISAFLFNGAPGSGPGPHRHPYDEVQFIQSGRGLWTVEGQEFEAGAGAETVNLARFDDQDIGASVPTRSSNWTST